MEKTAQLKLKWLLIGNLIVATGTSFMWPLTTVYMHNYLHQSLTTAGMVLFFNSVAMIIGSYVGGYIYDHLDVRKWLLSAILLATVAVFTLIFFNGWPIFAILLMVDSFAGGISNTIINSLATTIKSHDARYVFNMMYFMVNIGVVIGTLCVGFILSISINLIFVINFAMFALFFVVVFFCYAMPKKHPSMHQHSHHQKMKTKTSKKAILVIFAVLFVYMSVQIGYTQWQSNLSVYMETLGIVLKKYSFLWTMNGFIIVCGQPIINWIDEYYNVKVLYKLYAGALLFIIAFGSLIFAKDYMGFIISMIIVTVAEMYTFPTISAVVDELSSLEEKGKYQGYVGIAASIGRAIGPLFGGIIIDIFSYDILFVMMSLLVVLSLLSVLFAVKRLKA